MSASQGRPRTCGHIPDSADSTETLGHLLEFTDLARQGWVLDTGALYATMAFSREDVGTDAVYYAEDIRSHLPNDALRAVADQVIGDPNRQNIVSMGNHCRGWLYTVDAAKATKKDIALIRDAVERCDLYAAAFNIAAACARAAVHAYDYARREKSSVLHVRYIAVSLALLDRAQGLGNGTRALVPMTTREWIEQAMHRLNLSSAAYDEHDQACRTLAPKKAVTIGNLLSDMTDTPAGNTDLQVDLDALLSVVDPPPVIKQPPLPTVIVLRSLSHLPEVKSASQPNPRLEFASLAGVYMPLAETPDLQAASRELVAEMPWAKDVIGTILMDSVGSPISRVRNTLFVGKPGSGKTRLARRIGELLGMQPTIVPAAGVADSTFGGTSRSYATGRASTALQCVRRTGIANPLLIIDEVEKAASGNYNGRLADVLVPFLESESSQRIHDPFVETAVDLSRIGWIATANELIGIPGPLLDRLRVLEVPQPRRQDLTVVASTILVEIRQERGEDEIWMPALDGDELEILARQWRGGSLRPLKRMIETILSGRLAFAPRH